MEVDSRDLTFHIPADKLGKIKFKLGLVKTQKAYGVRNLARVVGTLQSVRLATGRSCLMLLWLQRLTGSDKALVTVTVILTVTITVTVTTHHGAGAGYAGEIIGPDTPLQQL